MILVDTSVWIDFFSGRERPQTALLERLLLDDADLALCGIVLTELLQGIVDDRQWRRVRRYLQPVIRLPMDERVFLSAAQIYRRLRKNGVTIRASNDCIIASTALRHRCQLLHADRDFDQIARHFPLRVAEAD